MGQATSGGNVIANVPLIAPAAIDARPSLMQRLRRAL
jgi:hypothetical protein